MSRAPWDRLRIGINGALHSQSPKSKMASLWDFLPLELKDIILKKKARLEHWEKIKPLVKEVGELMCVLFLENLAICMCSAHAVIPHTNLVSTDVVGRLRCTRCEQFHPAENCRHHYWLDMRRCERLKEKLCKYTLDIVSILHRRCLNPCK